jgi:hypothetical protein
MRFCSAPLGRAHRRDVLEAGRHLERQVRPERFEADVMVPTPVAVLLKSLPLMATEAEPSSVV